MNLTPQQQQNIEPFFNHFSNRTKIVPDPQEISDAVNIARFRQNNNDYIIDHLPIRSSKFAIIFMIQAHTNLRAYQLVNS